MTEKSFKERVLEQSLNFRKIYAEFAGETAADRRDSWEEAFEMPFPDGEVDFIDWQPNKVFNAMFKNEAVTQTLLELGVHEVWLRDLYYDDPRIEDAFSKRQFSRKQLVPPSKDNLWDERHLHEHNAISVDPIFWRALLEIFCRAFITANRTWTLEQTIDLAFDLDEIRRTLPGARWNKRKVRKIVNTSKQYASKYPGTSHQAGVGEDRIQEITDDIGPMDDGALDRLEAMFPKLYAKVRHQRALLKIVPAKPIKGNDGL
jgi:hypothetical protein